MKTITNEQSASEAEQKIQDLKVACLKSLKTFHAAKEKNSPVKEQITLYEDWCAKFDSLANFVESCIAKSELLGANRSEFWATELANTASNLLDTIPNFYQKAWLEASRLNQPPIKPSPNAFTAMQNSVAVYNEDQVDDLKERFEKLNLPVRGFTNPANMNTMYDRWEKITMVATVIAFMAILLAVGVLKTDYTVQGFFLIRAVLAAVAAAFAAIAIPGFLEVKLKYKKSASIRATGAIAVFVIVFLINPPQLVVEKSKAAPPVVAQ